MEQMSIAEIRANIKKEGVYNVDWVDISENQKLSESFMREYAHMVHWFWISINQKLSEDFIREFAHMVHWEQISMDQKLSEGFIREFDHKVNWYWISRRQKLSESFIREFIDKLPHGFDAVIANEFHCGPLNMPIHIYKSNPTIIHIGCFKGTKFEALAAVDKKHRGEVAENYKRKIRSCFRQVGR